MSSRRATRCAGTTLTVSADLALVAPCLSSPADADDAPAAAQAKQWIGTWKPEAIRRGASARSLGEAEQSRSWRPRDDWGGLASPFPAPRAGLGSGLSARSGNWHHGCVLLEAARHKVWQAKGENEGNHAREAAHQHQRTVTAPRRKTLAQCRKPLAQALRGTKRRLQHFDACPAYAFEYGAPACVEQQFFPAPRKPVVRLPFLRQPDSAGQHPYPRAAAILEYQQLFVVEVDRAQVFRGNVVHVKAPWRRRAACRH